MPCHHIISDEDIEKVYDIPEISSYDIETNCFDQSKKSAKIDIFQKTKKLNKSYITIEYCQNYELRGTAESILGKVVLCQTFFLEEEHQNLGLATSLFWKERDIYRNNNFNEIHLDAIEDGIIVWRSLGYNYLDDSTEANLMIRWYQYFVETFDEISEQEQVKIIHKTKEFEQVLRKYKVPNDKITFPEWLRSNNLVTSEPMFYKL